MVVVARETAYARGLVGHRVVAYVTLGVLLAILVQIVLLVVGGASQLAKRMSRLVHAAKYNYIQEVQRLVEDGECVDATDEHGRSAVIYAASRGNARILQLLLRKEADATRADKGGFTALHAAVYSGHTQCVALLLQARSYIPPCPQIPQRQKNGSSDEHVTVLTYCSRKLMAQLRIYMYTVLCTLGYVHVYACQYGNKYFSIYPGISKVNWRCCIG